VNFFKRRHRIRYVLQNTTD